VLRHVGNAADMKTHAHRRHQLTAELHTSTNNKFNITISINHTGHQGTTEWMVSCTFDQGYLSTSNHDPFPTTTKAHSPFPLLFRSKHQPYKGKLKTQRQTDNKVEYCAL